jgi:hypothetical protein
MLVCTIIAREQEEATYGNAVSLAVHVALGALVKADLLGRLRSIGASSGRLGDGDSSEGAGNEEGSETHLGGRSLTKA